MEVIMEDIIMGGIMTTQHKLTLGTILAATLAVIGCSTNDPGNGTAGRMSVGNLLGPIRGITAKPDSTPVHNPPPTPGPKQIVSLQSAGADSAFAGQTANTRWRFGNAGHASIQVDWALTNAHNWPGFPRQGSLTLAPLSSQVLTVAVAVPDTAQAGPCPLHMVATPAHGPATSADGAVQVLVGSPPSDSMVTVLR
jgi:hypothetical protein